MLDQSRLRDQLVGFVRSFAGGERALVATLAGQASTRRYHRVTTGGKPPSTVVMELPESDRPAPGTQLPFLNLQSYLARAHYPVPQVHLARPSEGLIALEDLGDQTLEAAVAASRDPKDVAALYHRAVDLIVQLQSIGRAHPDPECLAFGRRFDFPLLRWELDHFREWLLEADRQVRLSAADRAVVDQAFDGLARELADTPTVLVHRDFQSRNLMVLPGQKGPEIRVIDFQDALLGPPVYDLVALLRDSYLELEPGLVDELIESFAKKTDQSVIYITQLFHKQTLQRKLKDAGRFVFIDRMRKNPNFLPAIPLTLSYVRHALERLPELAGLREVLARHLPELR